MNDALRALPSVDSLLKHPDLSLSLAQFGYEALRDAVRASLDELRTNFRTEGATLPKQTVLIETLIEMIEARLAARFAPSLRPLINATGVILHTNLGRSPLSKAALAAMARVAAGYSNLEFELESGGRGKRGAHIESLVAEVFGAEAALVVNNTAAAVFLILNALAAGQEVVISRGQLIEIGGGFRMPDVMRQSGVHLVEVGTTNRTRLSDYTEAITPQTALLMRAHFSNFHMIGFTEEVALADLAALAHQHNLLCVDDLGSGAVLDTAAFGLRHEPTIGESVAAGADVIAFSGDKLLGGPQSGIIIGKAAPLEILKRHPLARALRVDKLTIAALAATLDHYRRGEALGEIPVWRMIAKPLDEIAATAATWAEVRDGEVLAGESTIGGGSLPGDSLPTLLYAPQVENPQAAQTWLREFDPPIITRLKDDRLLLDPRTVADEEIEQVSAALKALPT